MPPSVALVTGAFGFLGSHVADTFAAAGWRVLGLGHGGSVPTRGPPTRRPLANSVVASVQPDALAALAKLEPRVDCVVHAAGGSSVGTSWQDPFADFSRTVAGTAALVDALRRFWPDALLILPSSAAVYGHGPTDPLPRPTADPVSPYGWHKRQAEEVTLEAASLFGLRVVIVRFFSLCGPGLRKQVVWDLAQRLCRRPPLLELSGTGQEVRDFVPVADAAAALLAIAVDGVPDGRTVLNGGWGRPLRLADLAELAAAIAGRPCPVRFDGVARPGDPPRLVAAPPHLAALPGLPHGDPVRGLTDHLIWALAEAARAPGDPIPGRPPLRRAV